MKVLFITPNSDTHYIVPPLGLGYLAKSIMAEGFEAEILNGVKEKLNIKALRNVLKKKRPDVVGIQVFSCEISIVNNYLKLIKKEFPEIRTVVGGAHISAVGKETFEDVKGADFAFMGEAEIGFPLFLKELRAGTRNFDNIPGLIWKDGNDFKVNPPAIVEDLDKLGMPAWELMDPRELPPAPQGAIYRNFPIAAISTSRGCPYQCTYCANHIIAGRKIRARSVNNIIEEVEFLIDKFSIKELHIIDDTFTQNRERVKEFCEELLRRDIHLTLTFPNGARLNTLDEEILGLLKKCGCYSITVGVESGSQKILNDMKKALTIKTIKEKIKLINKKGIDVTAFFIIGYPTETRETIEQTIKFATELEIKRAHFSLFLPLPGTEATEMLKKEGRLGKVDWSKMFYTKVVVPPVGMTPDEVKSLQRKAYLKFYLRPQIIYYMIKEIRSWPHFKSLVKRAKDYGFSKN